MSIEWDNLRAAHLWSLAQDELDLAERLVEGSFQYAALQHAPRTRSDAAANRATRRRVRPAVDDHARHAQLLGRHARRHRRVAAPRPAWPRRRTLARPSRHRELLVEFAGATPSVAPGSPEALAAFQHQAAAVANTPDLDRNWFALVSLIDASLNADPSCNACVAATAERDGRPSAIPPTDHVRPSVRGPRLPHRVPAGLRRGDHRLRTRRRDRPRTGDRHFQAIALRCLAMASTGLGAPDALARCHDALDALFDIRYWQKIWQTLESVTLALATAGRAEQAAVILGHLDAHSPGSG